MTIVKELNELAKKMTGVNPKAKTDAQALNYIEQNYNGGDTPTPTQKSFDYVIPSGLYDDTSMTITDTNILEVLNDIRVNGVDDNGLVKPLRIGIYLENEETGNSGYFTIITQMSAYNGEVVYLATNSEIDTGAKHRVTISYYNGTWSSNIG